MNFPHFVKGIIGTDPIIYETKRHVAFIGRSNVGKSTLINTILGETSLVKSSSKPGHTRQINYFAIDKGTYYVDLPGYGYARLSKKEQAKVGKMISWYLFSSEISDQVVVMIIDAKIGPQTADKDLLDSLWAEKKPTLVVLNKADKTTEVQLQTITDTLQADYPGITIFPVSAKNGAGIGTLRNTIQSLRTS